MSDNKTQGGAGNSLGAHSKDTTHGGSATSAQHGSSQHGSSQQGSGHQGGGQQGNWQQGNWQQTGAEMAGQAKEGMERVAHTVRDAASSARDTIATGSRHAMESTGQMVRDQPMMALAVTGIACFAIGMMIGRGRY